VTVFIHRRTVQEGSTEVQFESAFAPSRFVYRDPDIRRLVHVAPDRPYILPFETHSATQGGDTVNIVGGSFGSPDVARGQLQVVLGETVLAPDDILVHSHSLITFLSPSGTGQSISFRVVLNGVSSPEALFSYDPPVVASIELEDFSPQDSEVAQGLAMLRALQGTFPSTVSPEFGVGTSPKALIVAVGVSSAGVSVVQPLDRANDFGVAVVDGTLPVNARLSTVTIRGWNFGENEPLIENIRFGATKCLPGPGRRTVWTSNTVLRCRIENQAVGDRGLSVTIGAYETQYWSSNNSHTVFACGPGFFGAIAGTDQCQPCPLCGTPECLGQISTSCDGGTLAPEAQPGFFRIDLTQPLEQSWAHISSVSTEDVLNQLRDATEFVRDGASNLLGEVPTQQFPDMFGMPTFAGSAAPRRLETLLPAPVDAASPNFTSAQRYLITPCLPATACVGENRCRAGHEGFACQRCSPDFYRVTGQDGDCLKCPDDTTGTIIIAVVGVLVIPVLGAAGYIMLHAPSTVGIALSVQTLQLLRQAVKLNMPWSSASEDVASVGALTQIDFSLSPPECGLDDWDFISNWYAYQAVPALLTAGCIAVYVFGSIFISIRERTCSLTGDALKVSLSLWITLLNLLFVGLVSSALEVFSCRDLGGKQVLSADVGIDCFGERYESLLGWAAISLFVYGMGITAFFALVLTACRKRVKHNIKLMTSGVHYKIYQMNSAELAKLPPKQRTERTRNTLVHDLFGGLYLPYTASAFGWAVLTLMHKFAVTSAATVYRAQPTLSSLLLGLELSMFMLLGGLILPFRQSSLTLSFPEAVRSGAFGRSVAYAQERKIRAAVATLSAQLVDMARRVMKDTPSLRPVMRAGGGVGAPELPAHLRNLPLRSAAGTSSTSQLAGFSRQGSMRIGPGRSTGMQQMLMAGASQRQLGLSSRGDDVNNAGEHNAHAGSSSFSQDDWAEGKARFSNPMLRRTGAASGPKAAATANTNTGSAKNLEHFKSGSGSARRAPKKYTAGAAMFAPSKPQRRSTARQGVASTARLLGSARCAGGGSGSYDGSQDSSTYAMSNRESLAQNPAVVLPSSSDLVGKDASMNVLRLNGLRTMVAASNVLQVQRASRTTKGRRRRTAGRRPSLLAATPNVGEGLGLLRSTGGGGRLHASSSPYNLQKALGDIDMELGMTQTDSQLAAAEEGPPSFSKGVSLDDSQLRAGQARGGSTSARLNALRVLEHGPHGTKGSGQVVVRERHASKKHADARKYGGMRAGNFNREHTDTSSDSEAGGLFGEGSSSGSSSEGSVQAHGLFGDLSGDSSDAGSSSSHDDMLGMSRARVLQAAPKSGVGHVREMSSASDEMGSLFGSAGSASDDSSDGTNSPTQPPLGEHLGGGRLRRVESVVLPLPVFETAPVSRRNRGGVSSEVSRAQRLERAENIASAHEDAAGAGEEARSTDAGSVARLSRAASVISSSGTEHQSRDTSLVVPPSPGSAGHFSRLTRAAVVVSAQHGVNQNTPAIENTHVSRLSRAAMVAQAADVTTGMDTSVEHAGQMARQSRAASVVAGHRLAGPQDTESAVVANPLKDSVDRRQQRVESVQLSVGGSGDSEHSALRAGTFNLSDLQGVDDAALPSDGTAGARLVQRSAYATLPNGVVVRSPLRDGPRRRSSAAPLGGGESGTADGQDDTGDAVPVVLDTNSVEGGGQGGEGGAVRVKNPLMRHLGGSPKHGYFDADNSEAPLMLDGTESVASFDDVLNATAEPTELHKASAQESSTGEAATLAVASSSEDTDSQPRSTPRVQPTPDCKAAPVGAKNSTKNSTKNISTTAVVPRGSMVFSANPLLAGPSAQARLRHGPHHENSTRQAGGASAWGGVATDTPFDLDAPERELERQDEDIDWDTLPVTAIPSKALFVAAFLLEEKRDLTWPTEVLRRLGMTKHDRAELNAQAAHSWRSLLKCPCLRGLSCRRAPAHADKPGGGEATNPLNAALHGGGGGNPMQRSSSSTADKAAPEPAVEALTVADESLGRACCSLWSVLGLTLLRNMIFLSLNYNLLGTLLNVFLFIAVQGALISASNTNSLPVELVAAALLAAAAGCTVLVEVVQAVMYTWWHQMALKVYCPDEQLTNLARKYVQSTQVKMQAGLRTLQRAGRRASGMGGPPPSGPRPNQRPASSKNPLSTVAEAPKSEHSVHSV